MKALRSKDLERYEPIPGEVFKYNEVEVRTMEGPHCKGCYFFNSLKECNIENDPRIMCGGQDRTDELNVYFVKNGK